MIYFDTETCGFEGPIILIQWAEDDGPITLHDVWYEPISETLELLSKLCYNDVCGFNLAFDWFHVCQTYTTLELLAARVGGQALPIDHIKLYAELEPLARDGICLKPKSALDLMMVARKGPYQSTMDRKDIRIKRVPRVLSHALCQELDERIPLKDVYFARSANSKRRWRVAEILDEDGNEHPNLVDVLLKFEPSSALKALAEDALEIKKSRILRMSDVEVDPSARPIEYGWAPYAQAVGKGGWPDVIELHIRHWRYNSLARQYAEDDVTYTRGLHWFFSALECGIAKPVPFVKPDKLIPGGDDDSELTICVGAVRWRGFKVDIPALQSIKAEAEAKQRESKYNFNSTAIVKKYLFEVMSPDEIEILRGDDGKISTDKITLELVSKWKVSTVCEACWGQGCEHCNLGLVESSESHAAAIRAREVIDYRAAGTRIGLYAKILQAGRFHASFKVIGTLSSRMSGDSKLNAQGIPHEKTVRSVFPLAWDDMQLSGGDFKAFEVGLADAVYGDPELREDLLTGKKIHALFGVFLFPGKTYEEILATDGLPGDQNLYGRSKNGVFALLYGGEGFTLKNRVGIPEEVGNEAYHRWCNRYKVWGDARKRIFDDFCSMTQPGGIGTKVVWRDPKDYIESMFGFRRYFSLENSIVKALFDMATEPPPEMLKAKGRIVRRDREQTPSGALRSALYAAAFALQATNMRAAANHVIQSSGAQLTKKLQRRLWDLQPSGINRWIIQPMNIHDEVMAPNTVPEAATRIVDEFVAEYKPQVPLLGIDWCPKMGSWADK